ncbi:hypothetical protein Amet_3866 [Alkaliphilus metalliredigens QYMF]|uniref:Uncharacterized protein n=1 Tax=Alkaliphilus metalliredigens (strain QYMF) TaxID=293826 RepID=A6TUW1_ALKMQ|nr:hypothetical protein [Alkaliphilus metalliredigens]ABR49979.1 hypothetical protein Amet_3866 [Alkaliphilus metalliredigens QYMF]
MKKGGWYASMVQEQRKAENGLWRNKKGCTDMKTKINIEKLQAKDFKRLLSLISFFLLECHWRAVPFVHVY